jgi:hypothetical protein
MIYKTELDNEYAILKSKFIRLSARYAKEILRGFCSAKNSEAVKIMAKYLDIICRYVPLDSAPTYAQVVSFNRLTSGAITIDIVIGTETFTYTGLGGVNEIINSFMADINASVAYSFVTEKSGSLLYIWSYDPLLSAESIAITVSDTNILLSTSTSIKTNPQLILNLYNCISDVELTGIIDHAYEITKKF